MNGINVFLSNFFFVRISDREVPKWVNQASDRFVTRFGRKYGHNPYDVRKHFVGKTFVYRVFYKTIAQGSYDTIFYIKKR